MSSLEPVSRTALVLQHEAIAHLGSLGPALVAAGYEIRLVDVTAEDPAAAPEPDLVVVLGGSVGAHQGDEHPYIAREIDFLRDRLDRERPTLGICLGSQLMASALGETVKRGGTNEIGFRTITPTDAGLDSPVRHVLGVPMMQWHSDTFGLPAGATRLASSSAYSNEAFALGDFALAVQFHPELVGEMYETWIVDGADELAAEGIDPNALRAEAEAHGAAMHSAATAMFTEWLGLQR